MSDAEAQAGWSMDSEGWEEAIPDQEFIGIIADFLIVDREYDRFPRPIRTISIRCEKLDTRGQLEDGTQVPLSVYSNASLERVVNKGPNKGEVRRQPRGKNKAAIILDNVGKFLPQAKTMVIPAPTDDDGTFVPLPEESWVSPKDGETKTANQVHMKELEGVKIRAILRGVVKLGGRDSEYEAKRVLEILEVLPPDFEVPEADIEIVPLNPDAADGTAAAANASVPGANATEVDEDSGKQAAVDALVGKTTEDGVLALMEMPEEFRVEPFVSGLSGDEAPLIKEFVENGQLIEVDGKLQVPTGDPVS